MVTFVKIRCDSDYTILGHFILIYLLHFIGLVLLIAIFV